MIKKCRQIHEKKYGRNDRAEGLPIESKEFESEARFIVLDDPLAITTKDNGVLIGDMGQLKILFKEALDVIEAYEKN